ncbi:Organic hydroperoxide reductase OsmC/OhrA [Flavobacterium fluvii]|uniref:Organic hydroperoxide reductase OsmC/OhrA n=1 Tax=Flavobacterium fluvii TaxID=468056 RepID=A0A1M5IUG6_9FLAO|nr:OsmC family protein [Flavobacterium fluvii]SHG31916.1 Organic hydroperoxide reductase OsmC/OhrA [Flavobacterium fluvii]
MHPNHNYKLTLKWTGNKGTGTSGYRAYDRNHEILIEGKTTLLGSADPSFHGDKTVHNPEDLLLASLSACHMMSYLHVCVKAGIIVTDYIDNATGIMTVNKDGSGQFIEATLNPIVTITDESLLTKANELHAEANKLCFIANSVNFPVKHNAETRV